MVELFFPPVPVVFDIMPPDISLVADAFFEKQVCQKMGFPQTLLLPSTLSTDEGDVRVAADVIQGTTVQITDIGSGVVEIDVFRTAGATDLLQVVTATHGQGIGEEMRKFECKIDSMECPQTAAGETDADIL